MRLIDADNMKSTMKSMITVLVVDRQYCGRMEETENE